MHTERASTFVAYCSLTILVALYVVGAVSHGSLRHEVQTLPLWFPIMLGFRQRELTKWSALPCLSFWLAIMVFIWLFLLGWARIASGHFRPVEIAVTVVIGIACVSGLGIIFRWRTSVHPFNGCGCRNFIRRPAAHRISAEPDPIYRHSMSR